MQSYLFFFSMSSNMYCPMMSVDLSKGEKWLATSQSCTLGSQWWVMQNWLLLQNVLSLNSYMNLWNQMTRDFIITQGLPVLQDVWVPVTTAHILFPVKNHTFHTYSLNGYWAYPVSCSIKKILIFVRRMCHCPQFVWMKEQPLVIL